MKSFVCKNSEREEMREIADSIFPGGQVRLVSGGHAPTLGLPGHFGSLAG